ncbi:hypothetical protein RyT2_17300 [Pseudolactococcus yaeyamensis]
MTENKDKVTANHKRLEQLHKKRDKLLVTLEKNQQDLKLVDEQIKDIKSEMLEAKIAPYDVSFLDALDLLDDLLEGAPKDSTAHLDEVTNMMEENNEPI